MTHQAQETTENKLYINENGVVSLEIAEDIDIDIATRLFVKSANDLKLEIKYPNVDRLDESPPLQLLSERKYLKTVYIPASESAFLSSRNLCESLLGLYPNFAYDPLKKSYKIIVQGFVTSKPLFKQQQIKIGNNFNTIKAFKLY